MNRASKLPLVNTIVEPNISLDGLHLDSEDNTQPNLGAFKQQVLTEPQTNQLEQQDIVQGLDSIISSFQNERLTKTQALMEILTMINQQTHLSELEKGQIFDNYFAQINCIEESRNSSGSSANIISSSNSAERSKNPARNSENLAEYKPLPENYKDAEHYWFYGWVLTDDFKRDYLIKRHMPVPNNIWDLSINVVYDLRDQVGYMLRLVGVQPDEITAAQGKSPAGGEEDEDPKDFDAIVVTCSIMSKRFLDERPTQAQMDKLTEIFGEEPRSLKDSSKKEEFDMDSWM